MLMNALSMIPFMTVITYAPTPMVHFIALVKRDMYWQLTGDRVKVCLHNVTTHDSETLNHADFRHPKAIGGSVPSTARASL